MSNVFILSYLRDKISLPCKGMERDNALYSFILENFWTKVGLKPEFRISNI